MKNRRFSKILLILMLAAIACFAFAGCEEFSFGEYGFENTVTESDWRDLEYPETDIVLDGDGSESIWQNTMPTSVKDETGEVTMTTKVHFGQEGAFFLMENDDPWIFYNTDRVVYHNTSMELYVSTTNTNLTRNTVQLRFGVNGYTEQWIGVDTSGEYAWTRVFVKCMSRIKVKGEINSADNEGYAIEAYMPYDQLGITEKPDKLYVLTAFCRANNNNSESHRVGWYGGGDINAPASYFPFVPEVGYIGGEIKNSPVGDFGGYNKTSGWDLSGLANADNPSVKTMAGSEQVIYFKNVQASKYAVSVMMEHANAINDSFPKAGILAAQNAKGMAVAMLDVRASNTHDLFAVRRPAGGNWNWPDHSDGISQYYSDLSYSNGVKITVVRSGVDFYYFINDDFVFANQNTMFGEEDTVAGLITFGSEDTFSEFETVTDAAEVDDMIAAIKHSDATNKWQWFGEFAPDGANAITLKPGIANVGNGEYYANKTDVTLTGNFELSFSVSDFAHAKIVPNWMTNYITTRLYRANNGGEDQFRLRLSVHEDDTGKTTNNPNKRIDAVFVGNNNNYSSTFDDIDFGSSAKKKIEIYRLVNGDKATFTVKVDGEQVRVFTSDYVGDYTFGFGTNYASGKISDIYAGAVRGDAGGYEITESHTGNGTVAFSKTTAQMGENVTVTITPEEGYKIGAFTVDGTDRYYDIVNKAYTFTVTDNTQINVTFVATTARTVTGTVSVSDESVGTVTGASMKFVNAEGENEVTIEANGTYSIDLSDGKYKVVVTHTNEAFRTYESNVTVSESNHTLDITLNGDPTVNGEMTGKDKYYTAARKVTIGGNKGKLDYYIYFGMDGFYMMFDVAGKRSELNQDQDNIEIAMQAGELGDTRTKDKNFHILIWSRLQKDGDYYAGYYDGIKDDHGRFDNANFIKPFVTQAATSNDNGFRLEMKFAYAMFGLDGKPATFAVAPAYKHEDAWHTDGTNDFAKPNTYFVCSKDGFAWNAVPTARTLDGDLEDWNGARKFSIVGSDKGEGNNATGKSVDFYGLLAEDGLYLAVDAHHTVFTCNQREWHRNTNFELFVGDGNRQHYVYAIGAESFSTSNAFMQIGYTTESSGENSYHTIIELFIPKSWLGNMIASDGSIRVGMAWKTIGDRINNGAANSGNMDEYWVPTGTWTNNADKAFVTANGIYTKADYEALSQN